MQRKKAQMAESVDALVSNTSGATRAGSTPALGTEAEIQVKLILRFPFLGKTFKLRLQTHRLLQLQRNNILIL